MKNKIKTSKDLKKKMLMVGVSLAILGSIYGANIASASVNRESRVEIVVNKFNLNKWEVNNFIEKYRGYFGREKRIERRVRFEKRLQDQVKKGNLTYDQKNLILEKRKEIEDKMNQDLKEWSEDRKERREQMEKYRKEMREWAEENGIDLGLLGLRKK